MTVVVQRVSTTEAGFFPPGPGKSKKRLEHVTSTSRLFPAAIYLFQREEKGGKLMCFAGKYDLLKINHFPVFISCYPNH